MKYLLLTVLLSGCTMVFWSSDTTVEQPVDIGAVINDSDEDKEK